jgi:hypothetical protein
MAVFGNLTEFPMLEIAGMLEQRCGVLRFENVGQYQNLELHLRFGQLQGLVVNGKVLRDGSAAKNLLIEIANMRQGQFEFQRLPENSAILLNDLSINLNEVMLRRATLDDEWHSYKDNLPDPETRFVLASEELVWLDDDLQTFWRQVESFLEYGISTKELASRLNTEVRLVQVYLYKFRVIGLIRPARRVQEIADIRAGHFPSPKSQSVLIPAVQEPIPVKAISKPTLVSRLLGALRLIGR